jgi:hypothetical protein
MGAQHQEEQSMTFNPATKAVVRSRHAALWLGITAIGIAIPVYSSGLLLAAHLACVGIAPVLAVFAFRDAFLRDLWIVSFLWAGAQFVSDLVQGGQLGSQPTVIGPAVALLATFLVWLVRANHVDATSVLIAATVGWIALELIAGGAAARGNVWKYGLSYPVALLLVALAQRARVKRRAYAFILFGLAALSVVADARFSAGLFLVCGALILIMRPVAADERPRSRAALVVVLAAVVTLYMAYPSIALSGALGERAYAQQVAYQAEGTNFLLATRMELPHTAVLFALNPLLGIGAHGSIDSSAAQIALDVVNDYVTPLQPNDIRYLVSADEGTTGYHAHTAALASLLFAGLLAAPFWLNLVLRNFRALTQVARGTDYFVAPALLLIGQTTWDLLFSPLNNRLHVSLALAFFVLWILNAKASQSSLSTPQSQLR